MKSKFALRWSRCCIVKCLSTALAAVALLPALFGHSACADIVTVTVSGTITDGVDVTGAFGTPGSSVTGDSYVIVYTFDTSIGATSSTNASGGTSQNSLSPSLSTTVTINGQNFTFVGNYWGQI